MGISDGTENVTANVPDHLAQAVAALAFDCGLTRSRYVRALLEDAVRRKRKFRFVRGEYTEETAPCSDGCR